MPGDALSHPAPLNLGSLLGETAERHSQKTAVLHKRDGRQDRLSWAEFLQHTQGLSAFLLKQGVKPGDRLAILSENRPEWVITDMAALSIGVVTVPIYTSLTPAEIEYILRDSQAAWLAVSAKPLLDRVIPIVKSLPNLRGVIAFDPSLHLVRENLSVPLHVLKDSLAPAADHADVQKQAVFIGKDHLASLIYTSGTTGMPKGVMLTHGNFIHNVLASERALNVGPEDVHLSFLPLSHVFERMAGEFLMIRLGATIAYAENMDSVPQNLLDFRPTLLLGVPRFFEKTKDRTLETVAKAGPLKKALFLWAQDVGRQNRLLEEKDQAAPFGLRLKRFLADRLVAHKFKKRLGGRLRFCVSGGAALPVQTAHFFHDLGLVIYEGYGLTETSPVISVNRPGRLRFGTVGIPLEGVEVKIAGDGEILTKSPSVMRGYFGKEEETRQVLDAEGWFCTGDLGSIDREGFLKIVGRKKELIVTSGGKKISPKPIEEMLESDPAILRCVLYGEGRKCLTAFIVPRREALLAHAEREKIAFASYEALLQNSRIRDFIENRIGHLTSDLAGFEKIKTFALLENDFTQAAGELTPTLKIKREVIASRYGCLLEPFYDRDKAGPAA